MSAAPGHARAVESGLAAESDCVAHLRAGRSVVFVARGASMRPVIRDGDWVRIDPLPPRCGLNGGATIRIGDVVWATQKRSMVLHRVLWSGPTSVVLQGDRNAAVQRVPVAAVVGRLGALRRPGGQWTEPLHARRRARLAGWAVACAAGAIRRQKTRNRQL